MIFIDRSIPRSVARALQAVRDDVRWLDDEFPATTPDPVWLAEVGRRGWLAVTRDKKIRTRPGERAAIASGGVGCFVLEQKGNLTRWQYLRLLALTLDEMEAFFVGTPRPFLCAVTEAARLRLLP